MGAPHSLRDIRDAGASATQSPSATNPIITSLAHGGLSPAGHHAPEAGESSTHTHAGGSHPDLAAHDTLGLATQAELDAHGAATDPHTGYQRESEKGLANGYASLDAGGVVPDAQIPATIARDSELHTAFVQADHDALANPHHSNANDHAASHTLASHSAKAHSDLTGIGATDHHSNANDHVNAILNHDILTPHTGFPGGTANFLRADGTFAAPPGGGGGMTLLKKTANQIINAGAGVFVDITDLTFPVVAGVDYAFHFYITFQSAAAATGWKASVNCPAGTLDFWAQSDVIANGAAGVATHTERHNTVRDDMTLLTATITQNVDLAVRIEGRYICTANGTFAARFANELAANTQIVVQKGSWGWYF